MKDCNDFSVVLQQQLSPAFPVHEENGVCVVGTPFFYPDNTSISLVIERCADGTLTISDDGNAHHYAWSSGVGRTMLSNQLQDITLRFDVDASHGEVVLFSDDKTLVTSLSTIIQATQSLAEIVSRKKLGGGRSRFARAIETELVVRNRVYERNGRVRGRDKTVRVDYNVLPGDGVEQLSLFSVPADISSQRSDAMAYRVTQVLAAGRRPGLSGRVLILVDDQNREQLSDRVRYALEGVQGGGATIVPFSDRKRLDEFLSAA